MRATRCRSLKRRPNELRTFLLAIAQPLPGIPEAELRALVDGRVRAGAETAFGSTLDALDLAWRAWVKKNHPK